MNYQKANQAVVFCEAQDFVKLAVLYDLIAKSVPNKAFFNWSQEKAIEEMRFAKSLIIKDQPSKEVMAFVTYRDYDDRLEISAVGTNPAHLKRGLAQKVLESLKANAAQRSLAIWLEVHENNQTAVNLYLKNGFVVLNTRKRYYPDGGGALVMQFAGG